MSVDGVTMSTLAMPGPRPTAAVVFLRTLVELGVDAAFGVPGGTISSMYMALEQVPQIRHVAMRHECSAVFAAVGYAKITGRPAIVLTTSGPGITNTLTGLATALYERVPVILLGGEVSSSALARGAIQDGSAAGLSVQSILRPVCRWIGSLSDASTATATAVQAWTAAMAAASGPVMVRVPLDIGGRDGRPFHMSISDHHPVVRSAMRPSDEACREVARLLTEAERPLLVMGNGARGAHHELVELAERAEIPSLTTGHGKGVFPESHPLYVGVMGIGQHPSVPEHLAEPSDVTLIVGSRLNDLATNGWSLPLQGSIATIQIDRDPTLIGCNAPVTHGLVGDAQATVRAILDLVPSLVLRRKRRIVPCRSWPVADERPESAVIKPQSLLAECQRQLPRARWVSDIGEHLAHAIHTLRVEAPDRFFTMLGYGSMGSGVCSSMGIKLAEPDQVVVCICGDGGFATYLADLMTCVENRLGVVFVVFNDGRWNMVEHGFEAVYGSRPVRLIDTVADLGAIARAMGARAVRVDSLNDLRALDLRALAGQPAPLVIDARVDADEALTRDTRSASIKHFHGGLDHAR